MCLAIPGVVEARDGEMAQVRVQGIILPVSLALTPEVEVGDYVLVHTGYAIQKLTLEEAEETLKLLTELVESWEEPNPK